MVLSLRHISKSETAAGIAVKPHEKLPAASGSIILFVLFSLATSCDFQLLPDLIISDFISAFP